MDEAISLKSNKSTIETDISNDSDTSNKMDVHNQVSHSTLALLSKLTFEPIEGLANTTLIKSLLTYIKYTKDKKASEILISIVR